jgi:hypothetical protein
MPGFVFSRWTIIRYFAGLLGDQSEMALVAEAANTREVLHQVKSILAKLGANDQTHAAVIRLRKGLIFNVRALAVMRAHAHPIHLMLTVVVLTS